MVLLITSADRGQECVQAIQRATSEEVHWAADTKTAMGEFRRHQFSVVVVEEWLWESDRRLEETFAAACDSAALLVTNLAIAGATRVANEVGAALRRRAAEIRKAREEVERRLRCELNEAVTGILLCSELALATPALPSRAEAKIRSVYQFAMSIRARLQL